MASIRKKYNLRLPATTTLHIQTTVGPIYHVDTDVFGELIHFSADNDRSIVIYEWDLSTEATSLVVGASSVVTQIDLEYYHYEADSGDIGPAGDWDIKYADSGRPSIQATDALKWASIVTDGELAITDTVKGDQKTIRSVTIGESGDVVCAKLQTGLINGTWFALGLQKTDGIVGQMSVGGLVMAAGIDMAWHEATGVLEPEGPPAIVITIEQNPEDHIEHLLKYTTTDPTTIQSTPSNSIGGHASSNNVYTRAQTDEVVSSTQTTIPISTLLTSTLPTETGLAQLGPEIFKFEGIDTTNEQLTNVTRGIAPPFSYPAPVSPFSEYVHYLVVDNLFDRRPSLSLVQYRCVALLHSVTNASQTARNTKVYLVQDPDADVQVDIGIEVPKHDYIGGVLIAADATGSILTSTNSIWELYSDDFFVGSHIIVDPDDTIGIHHAIIESYSVAGNTAEFIIDSPLGATYLTGEDFEIHPAPSQIVSNESVAPTENSGRFLGFFQDGGPHEISAGGIRRRGGQMINNDVIYLWVKRTLQNSKKEKADTGAVIITVFDDEDLG